MLSFVKSEMEGSVSSLRTTTTTTTTTRSTCTSITTTWEAL